MNSSSISNFKIFILRMSVFFSLLWVTDYILGKGIFFLYRIAITKQPSRIESVIKSKSSIIILGSSRAEHHYIPSIIEKKTGRTTFNGGRAAVGLTYIYGLEQLVLQQSTPELLILELFETDLVNNQTSSRRIQALIHYRDNPIIDNLVKDRSQYESIKFLSALYPYNSEILQIIDDIFSPHAPTNALNGYTPKHGIKLQNRKYTLAQYAGLNSSDIYIPEKYKFYLTEIIKTAIERKTKILIVYSPTWYKCEYENLPDVREIREYLKKVTSQYGIPILDYSKVPFRDSTMFYNNTHLNHKGAIVFSNLLADTLKTLLDN